LAAIAEVDKLDRQAATKTRRVSNWTELDIIHPSQLARGSALVAKIVHLGALLALTGRPRTSFSSQKGHLP